MNSKANSHPDCPSAHPECPTDDQLRQLLSGAANSRGDDDMEKHLGECELCQGRLDAIAGTDDVKPEGAPEFLQVGVDHGSTHLSGPGANTKPTANGFHIYGMFPFLDSPPKVDDEGNCQPIGQLGSYQILKLIGQGGMGAVFLARDTKLDRLVAIKTLLPGLASQHDANLRFAREARTAAKLEHANIVAIHTVEEESDTTYLVMQLVDGKSLAERLTDEGKLPIDDVISVARQVAEGLDAAHRIDLIHRDIKPANLLFERDGRIKITDFGLAKATDDSAITRSGVAAGTPEFMSPEQAACKLVDERSDLFSLGVVLYTALVGDSPFRADSSYETMRRINEEPPPPISSLRPDCPTWLEQLIERLLQKNPKERLQNAAEVVQAIDSKYVTPIRQERTSKVGLLAAMCMGILIALGAFAFWPSPKSTKATTSTTSSPSLESSETGPPPLLVVTTTEGQTLDLSAAIDQVARGGIIEIDADGPIPIRSLHVEKPVTIRAADYCRPVLVPLKSQSNPALTSTEDLSLEGIDVDWRDLAESSKARDSLAAVLIKNGEFTATNCNFAVGRAVAVDCQGPSMTLTGCEMNTETGMCVRIHPSSKCLIENCTLVGERVLLVSSSFEGEPSVEIDIRSSSFRGNYGLYVLCLARSNLQVNINMVDNFLDVSRLLTLGSPRRVRHSTPDAATRFTHSLVNWTESGNQYSADTILLSRSLGAITKPMVLYPDATMEQWEEFWGMSNTGSKRLKPAPSDDATDAE